jgi:hypothetical protein
VGIGEHRFSTSDPGATPDLSCLAQPGAICSAGTPEFCPQLVTLTGYVWLFASGQDSANVTVEVLAETRTTAPDASVSTSAGSFSTAPIGVPFTTTPGDKPIDPTPTTWRATCPNGCSYRQYTITGVPTETPLVLHTSDGNGARMWGDLFEYGIYLRNADVQNGTVSYNATAVTTSDAAALAAMANQSADPHQGVLVGEVHDCNNLRLAGASVETDQPHTGPLLYTSGDEANPALTLASDTSRLGSFVALNLPPSVPIRVTAVGQCPSGDASGPALPGCTAGGFTMLGTYVVQVFPSAVTLLSLRGRRPWQL